MSEDRKEHKKFLAERKKIYEDQRKNAVDWPIDLLIQIEDDCHGELI